MDLPCNHSMVTPSSQGNLITKDPAVEVEGVNKGVPSLEGTPNDQSDMGRMGKIPELKVLRIDSRNYDK